MSELWLVVMTICLESFLLIACGIEAEDQGVQ
jgi:hypothetical protein